MRLSADLDRLVCLPLTDTTWSCAPGISRNYPASHARGTGAVGLPCRHNGGGLDKGRRTACRAETGRQAATHRH